MIKSVVRQEDMSPTGRLRVTLQVDGDIIVTATDGDGNQTSVEFCSITSGGGESPRTQQALRDLYIAMELDNKDPACFQRALTPKD